MPPLSITSVNTYPKTGIGASSSSTSVKTYAGPLPIFDHHKVPQADS
jgi:hypothetical protein